MNSICRSAEMNTVPCRDDILPILVVDDDDAVRTLLVEFLQEYGFRVIEAPNAQVARICLRSRRGRISLMITDVIMPGDMNGMDLARWASENYPSVEIMITSGYSGYDGSPYPFLSKPYRYERIAELVKELVGERRNGAGALHSEEFPPRRIRKHDLDGATDATAPACQSGVAPRQPNAE